jgi:hypothetical protein
VSSIPVHSEADLTAAERTQLEAALHRLQSAVRGYERFIGGELKPGEPVPVHSASEMAAAQAELDTAEQELWRLREEILGQGRPPWAASAASVSAWFSPEDAVYDEDTDTAS